VKHFLQLADFERGEFEHLFERTRIIKDRFKNYVAYQPLADRMLAMVFEKSSTRTRVSFEAGIFQLGGASIVLNMGETQLGRGEPIEDVARVVSRMVDIVMIRTFEHSNIERFASQSRVPVINGLTNDYHPCQVLADIYTYAEHRGAIEGKVVAWVGDGNNMCNTWIQAARIFGFRLNIATPAGYGIDSARAAAAAGHIEIFADPLKAVQGAHLVNTDVWTSMGFEAEAAAREEAFRGFTVDRRLMSAARADALFMHCLPAHRGEEVSADVLESPQSVVWEEAENRLHVQKALMEYLLLGRVDA
jgi:ornithine carbamoyltransferase